MRTPSFSIIIPCFNEEEALPALLRSLVPNLETHAGPDWEVIFVDDGSHDCTLELIAQAHQRDPRVKAIALSRNFGHQPALACGLAFASGEIIGVMDCDLQDTPEVLIQLYGRVKNEGFDVCYGVRREREGSRLKRFCYRIFYRAIGGLSEHPWPEDAGDFSVFNRRVHRAILALPERVRVLRGLRSWVGFRQTEIAVNRPDRRHGRPKYHFFKLVSLALNSFTGFSYVPLRVASLLGIFMGIGSLFLGALLLINRWFPKFTILHYYIGANPGTTTIILFLAVIASMIFFCLGIMGEYLVLVLKEIKGRPTAIASQLIGDFPAQPGTPAIVSASRPSTGQNHPHPPPLS